MAAVQIVFKLLTSRNNPNGNTTNTAKPIKMINLKKHSDIRVMMTRIEYKNQHFSNT